MVVITCTFIAVAVGAVCYWLGRARRMNHGLRHHPEDYAYDPDTGEIIERGSAEWEFAEKHGFIKEKGVKFE